MKKNIIIVALVFILPLFAYWIVSSPESTTAKTVNSDNAEQFVEIGKPQLLKFTSSMCLDCQTMNKLIKEVFPKYQKDIVLREISVQDGKAFTNEQIQKYNVTLVPTMIFIDSNGKQVRRIEGAIERSELEKYLEEIK